MKRNKLTNFLTATTILISTLLIWSSPADSRPARRTLQSLPNGVYFYSNARLPQQSSSQYIILRKRGRSFILFEYLYQEQLGSYCKSGTIRGNILNETKKHDFSWTEEIVSRINSSTNLNDYYQLSANEIQDDEKRYFQDCINIMSR